MKLKNAISSWKTTLVKDFAKVFSLDLLLKASNFILLPVYLSLMSQNEFGLYGYLISFITSVSLVLNFGLYIPQSKLYQNFQDPQAKGQLLFTINILILGGLTIVLLSVVLLKLDLYIFSIMFNSSINIHTFRLPILIAIFSSVYSLMLFNFFMTIQNIKKVQLYNFCKLIFINLISIIALYISKSDKSLIRIQSTYVTEISISLLFAFYYIKKMHFKFDWEVAKKSMFLGLPVMISAMIGIVINFGDKFFLERFGNFRDLSIYYLAITIGSIIPLMLTTFQNIWLPYFFKETDVKRNIAKTKKIIKVLFFLFLLLSILIWLCFKTAIAMGIIKSNYNETVFILPFILVSQIVSSLTPLLSNYLIYFEKTYLVPLVGLPLSLLSLGLNYYLIREFNVYGAAVSSLFINILYFVVYYVIVKKIIEKRNIYEKVIYQP